ADFEIERVPAPDVALPRVAGKIAELDAPVETGAERVRVDIVVDEAGLVEDEADILELPGDLGGEVGPFGPFASLDRHVDVDIAPDHQVVAGAAGDLDLAEALGEQSMEPGLAEQRPGINQQRAGGF